MSDQVFAAVAETGMGLSVEQGQQLLVSLARFEIEAFERARRVAPARSPEVAAFDSAREAATQETLRRALLLRDREVARAPLRHVAQLLRLHLDEESEDWRGLAIEAVRVLLDVSQERARRDQGIYPAPSPAFRTALARMEAEAAGPAVLPRLPMAIPEGVAAPLPFASALPLGDGVASVTAPRAVGAEVAPAAWASGAASPPWQAVPVADPARGAGATAPLAAVAPVEPCQGAGPVPAETVSAPHQGHLGDDRLSAVGLVAPAGQGALPAQVPMHAARPLRTPGQEAVLHFYLKHLSPDLREAALRPSGPRISEAFRIFYALKALGFDDRFEKIQKIIPNKGPRWVNSSGNKVDCAERIWVSFLGDQPFEQVQDTDITDTLDLLWRVPRDYNRGPKWEVEDFREIIERADLVEARETERAIAALSRKGSLTDSQIEKIRADHRVKRLRVETYLKHGRTVAAVGRTLHAMGIIHINSFSICSWTNREEADLRSMEETRARTAWDDRIHKLYRTPVFQGQASDEADAMFWTPLITRHLGLRSEECLQLGPDDFGSDQGIPYLRIRNLSDNEVKSASAERLIPLHPNLIELGLLRLVELRRKQGHRRLFSNVRRGAIKNTFTETFTKNFGYYRKVNNVYWLGLDVHAFRTTFHADLMNSLCSDLVRRRLMGHAPLDEGEKSYAQNLAITTLREAIGMIRVDISMIRSPFAESAPSGARARADELGLRLVG